MRPTGKSRDTMVSPLFLEQSRQKWKTNSETGPGVGTLAPGAEPVSSRHACHIYRSLPLFLVHCILKYGSFIEQTGNFAPVVAKSLAVSDDSHGILLLFARETARRGVARLDDTDRTPRR